MSGAKLEDFSDIPKASKDKLSGPATHSRLRRHRIEDEFKQEDEDDSICQQTLRLQPHPFPIVTTSTLLFISAAVLLGVALLVLGWRAWLRHQDIERLRRNGWRRIAMRQARRGWVDPDFVRSLSELTLLVLMLVSVLGWLGAGSTH